MAEEAKVRGNAAYAKRDYRAAIRHYSDAIALDPDNHVLYSNRSAAYAALEQWTSALSDARKTHSLKPEWPRSHLRVGIAVLGLGRFDYAVHAFKQGLALDPDDEALKSGYEKAKAEARKKTEPLKPHSYGDTFNAVDMWEKLTSDTTTGVFAQQNDFIEMMRDIQKDWFCINQHSKDPRLVHALGVLLNVNFRTVVPEFARAPEEQGPAESSNQEEEMEAPATEEEEVESEEDEDDVLDAVMEQYFPAIGLEDGDDKAIVPSGTKENAENLRDLNLDEMKKEDSASGSMAKESTGVETDLTLKSNVYKAALESLRKSLSESRYPELLDALHEASRQAKELEQMLVGYSNILDVDHAEEQLYLQILLYHYRERLTINSRDTEAYSNRAACYMKLREFSEAMKDAEKCIELEPKSSMGYRRKGDLLFHMEEYNLATETYLQGLHHDPSDLQLSDSLIKCVKRLKAADSMEESEESEDEAVPKPSPDPKKGAVSAPADVEQESPGSSEALKEADLGEAETRVDD
ncbi:hsp70-Hsp90 organizing protein 1-like isoform X2 [Punica granatum]|uniref:Hsp70-Hsp90 organizing protein 1-like isoform X2 n=1 Tax=Punica granatum TaxID=22663 RepID=A0A6P8D714_PUNGR|nr:hsp70-Hsp90 organizing protein 1-like isoform X2 [Punica granatum]